MRYLGLLVIVAMLVCIPMLLSKNAQLVDLNYHFGSLTSALSHQLLAAFCLGFLACLLILLPLYLGIRWRLRKSRKRIIALESAAGIESTADSVSLSRRQQKKAARKAAKKRSVQATRNAQKPPAAETVTKPGTSPGDH